MSRRNSNAASAEVSLFPFLSILACLIGILTMMIKIISDMKSQEESKRDPNELARAQQHQQLRADIKKTQTEIEKMKAVLKERNATLVELSELENKRIVLRKQLADKNAAPKESDEALQKLLEQLIDQSAALRKERPSLEKQLAELKAELEKRKIKPDTKPQPVRINPADSGIAANTKLTFIECNATGIVILDASGKKVPKKADVKIYDQEKVVSFFATKNLKIRKQSISVPYNKPWTRLNMRITFKPSAGDATLADCEQPRGRFYNICQYVKQTRNSVVIFKVHPNSFATYLKAREIADSLNVPCGWEIDGSDSYQEPLDFEVNRLEQPPPPKPGQAPQPPAPKRKLD